MANGRNKFQSRENRARVRELFLREWDLCGVRGNEDASDEYDAYAAKAYVMLMEEGATADLIANYLFDVATVHMGLTDTFSLRLRCEEVAESLCALRSEFGLH